MKTEFLNSINKSISNKTFVKLTLSRPKNKTDLKNVYCKLSLIKQKLHLTFIFRHLTKDITKNFLIDEGIIQLEQLLGDVFFEGHLFTTEKDITIQFFRNKTPIIKDKKASFSKQLPLGHDKEKKRLISTTNNNYLKDLSVLTESGEVRKDKTDKFRQINKFVELIAPFFEKFDKTKSIKIIDMGSGKGYLTFALYDYLVNNRKLNISLRGIEQRENLVSFCNKIAEKSKFDNLKFEAGQIKSIQLQGIDVLIALHACDTATDDAIFRGINAEASIIIVAPCCQKQLRNQIKPTNALKSILKYGILKERQSELLTDGLRAMILEAYGYKTNVFEFIQTEHTPKNIMIVGIKKKISVADKEKILDQIKQIKNLYDIEYHYLEKLFKNN
ncbi:MAG: SAM-dependent methyltransferase [Bacteroidales bacterium]|nr:SAM-dependent methyltransferase [Bacteroidales bacterium]